ncbi:hypothetical protein R6Q57_020641 [Mikania cordata]
MEVNTLSSQTEIQQNEPGDVTKFSQSLQELKDLCSQLHAAAGYSESTFLNSNHKHLVVENTKEYVCRAVVAVVDHLGSVSANLFHNISDAETDTLSKTEVKIGLLKQKLFVCQEYSNKLAQAKLTRRAEIPRYNSRYTISPVSNVSIQNSKIEIVANPIHKTHGSKINEEVAHVFYNCMYKSPSQSGKSTYENDKAIVFWSPSALSVNDHLAIQPKPQVLSFQLQEKHTRRRGTLFRNSMTSNEILSIIRRRK